MALPSSGVLKWSAIQTEFGGTDPVKLSEYYGQSSLPSSGLIKASDFYGTSALLTFNGLTASATSSTENIQTLTDSSIISLLSGVSASSIVITKMTCQVAGYYYAEGTNSQDWSSNYHTAKPTYQTQLVVSRAPQYLTGFRNGSATLDCLNIGTNAQRQAFIKAGLPTEYRGIEGSVGFVPDLTYVRWDLAFTAPS